MIKDYVEQPDMTLLDEFAMSALNGLISCLVYEPEEVAAMSYDMAKAMMKERLKHVK